MTECTNVNVNLKTEKDLEKKCEAENSLNTKVKEEDAKKGIKSEGNTDDVKIKDEYKVPSNGKVQESKSKKKEIKLKVKKMELRSEDRFQKLLTKSKLRLRSNSSKDKIFLSSPVKKMDKKHVVKVEKKEKKNCKERREKCKI